MKVLILFFLASYATGFSSPSSGRKSSSFMEVDFDAPVERQIAVGNVVRSKKEEETSRSTVGLGRFGSVRVPAFISKRFNSGLSQQHEAELMSLDDECYLGKNGDLDGCADFDPLRVDGKLLP